uniref:Shortage in chiasmata 1 n=1 Tax=Crocodylus porosus TaxID=8502 RepID=A0A7M4G105_CROPO
TPPCKSQRSQLNSLCAGLQAEPISPEQHCPLKADWWLYSGLNLVSPDILEQLVNIDLTSANSLLPTQVETFSRITSTQLESKYICFLLKMFSDENDTEKSRDSLGSLTDSTKNQCSPLHMKAAQCGVIHDVSIPAEKLTREEIEQNKTERPTHFLNQEKEDKNNLESLSCKEVSFEPNSSSRNERNIPAELTRKCDDGSDLLSNFIMLRSKHVLIENEEKNNVAEGQCQAYHILAAAATPVLKVLMDLGMLASESWRFAAIKFDHTRFFLRQQEKVICDDFKQGYLSKAKDIYKSIFGSCLDNIWRQLEIIQFSRQKKHETNPKLIALHHHMLNWIIFFFFCCFSFSLNKCSCAIVNYQHIRADFPWTHFSLVVEFDYTENSCWNKLCKNLNIPYITFKTTLPETVVMSNHFGSFLLETQIPYVLFTSEGLLNSPEILQLLESKHKITFVERCCSESLQLFGDTDRYVVLTIDEHTAIVLQNVEELSCEKSADNIILRLIALSLQYSCCWIILYSRERLSSEYSLTGKTLHHLALIYAGLISFAQKSEDFEVKMALAPGIEETALLIRQIANNILVSSQTNPHEWLDRSWLSVLPTEAEKHLLAFPCLNPLVAQLMLKRGYSLNRLLSATFDQLQELLPEVPEKVLKLFSDITSLHNLNSSIPTTTLVRTVSPQENWNVSNTFSPASFPKSLISSIQGNQKDQCSELPDNVQNTINQSWDFYKNRSGSPLKSSESQRILASSLPYYGWVSCPEETDGSENSQHYLPSLRYVATERAVSPSFLKQNNSNIFTPSVHVNYEARIPPLSHSQDVTDSNFSSYLQKDFHASNAAVGSKLVTSDSSVLPKNSEAFVHQDINNHLFHVQTQPLTMHCNSDQASKQEWYLVSKKDDFFANFNEFPFQRSSKNFLEKFAGMADSSAGVQYKGSLWPEYPYDHTLDSSAPDFSLCDSFANPNEQKNLNFYPKARESSRKRRPGESLLNLKEKDVLTGLGLVQVPQLKKKRLTFEKVPGRSDGQTRLKFF